VVVYDARASVAAARAWWLLRYFGHPDVAVLDGGLAAWRSEGLALTPEAPTVSPGTFQSRPGGLPVLDAQGAARLAGGAGVLIDARASERFAGEQEPVDPVAGHIPGARNHPAAANLRPDGRFLAPDVLREALRAAGVSATQEIGAYCGSGAGYRGALYPGSWSEWITDPTRPAATGA
jgi:thiosulfate/3-mercaptopyruvate sulfurtransferase